MDKNKLNLKHIKLDKLIHGKNQHIFKTNIQTYRYNEISGNLPSSLNNNINYNKFNTVFYSTFDKENTFYNEYTLLDFDEINFLYKDENKTFNYLNQYLNNTTNFYKKYFNKYLIPSADQDILYYKTLEKPIDIINLNNMSFFLSPLQVNKQMEILNQDVMLKYKNVDYMKATNKPNYELAYNFETDRTVSYAENNNIPIYDLNFNFLDTIQFNSLSSLYNWITDNNLLNISSNITYIDETDNYYSINMHSLLSALALNIDYNYYYSENNIKNTIADLVSRIDLTQSPNRYIDKYGIISKLNKKYFYLIKDNKILSSIFNDTLENIKLAFNKRYTDTFTVNDIPQNTLYISNLEKTLLEPSQIYDKTSTYLNYVNLKNKQTPNYEYDIEFPEKMFDIINFIDDAKYITLDRTNRSVIQEIAGNTKYLTKYVSGIFYIKKEKYETYQNNLAFIFYPSGINPDDEIIKKTMTTTLYPIEEKEKITSSVLSSHLYEAMYDFSNMTASANQDESKIEIIPGLTNLFYNKARGINFTIAPEYLYKEEPSHNVWYKNAYEEQTLVNIYFPSATIYVSCIDSTGSIISENILANDFTNVYETQHVSGSIDLSNIPTNYSLNYHIVNSLPATAFYGQCVFKLYRESIFNDMDLYIDNYVRMLYFDNDRNKTLTYNKNKLTCSPIGEKYYINPIKTEVSSLLNKTVIADNYLALTDEEYRKNYSDRISGKVDNYLHAFNEYHIENNRLAEVGNLNGLRVYEHVGRLNNNIMWSSYKYISLKSTSIEDTLNTNENIQLNQYNINRFSKNMEFDDLGNINYQGIDNIRTMTDVQEIEKYAFSDINKQYLCSSCFYCNKPKDVACTEGYCTFPYYNINKYYINNCKFPHEIYWNLSSYIQSKKTNKYNNSFINNTIFKLDINKQYDQIMIVNSDLNVNDDIEIFFIHNTIDDQEIYNILNNYQYKQYYYKSIFQGFGRNNLTDSSDLAYPHYLMINNKENTIEKRFKTITISSLFYPLHVYVNNTSDLTNKSVYDVFNDKDVAYYLSDFLNLEKSKEETYIDKYTKEIVDISDEERIVLSTTVNSLLENSNYGFLISGTGTLINTAASAAASYTEYALNEIIQFVDTYTYREVAYTNIYDMLCTNKRIINHTRTYGDVIRDFCLKKSLTNTYILNHGFVLSPYTPFNGPHTIKSDTQLAGLLLNGTTKETIINNLPNDKVQTTIPAGFNVYMRIINWWNDLPKFTGSILIKPTKQALTENTALSTVTNVVNNFDFAECITDSGLLKLNQSNYKKSNIYSVKIKNSGLNPEIDPFANLKSAITLRDYIDLSEVYQKLYTLVSFNDINIIIETNKDTTKKTDSYNELYNDLYYISYTTTISFLQITLPDKENIFKNPALYTYYQINNGYYKLNYEKVNLLYQLKEDLRNNLETAIKNSVSRYMPIETKLWKIIYEGN